MRNERKRQQQRMYEVCIDSERWISNINLITNELEIIKKKMKKQIKIKRSQRVRERLKWEAGLKNYKDKAKDRLDQEKNLESLDRVSTTPSGSVQESFTKP